MLILLLLLVRLEGGRLSLLLPLLEFVQALRLRAQHGYLLLHIAVGLHQTVKHDRKVIIELELLLLEQLRDQSGLLYSEAAQLLQVIGQLG